MNTSNYTVIEIFLLVIALSASCGFSEYVEFKVEKPTLIMPQDHSKVAFDGEIYFSDSDPSWDWDNSKLSQPQAYQEQENIPFRQLFKIGGRENDWTGLHSIRYAQAQV